MLGEPVGSSRINLDGILVYSGGDKPRAYTQLFRNGTFESVSGHLLTENSELGKFIPHVLLEQSVVSFVRGCLSLYSALEIPTPLAIFLSILNAAGHTLPEGYPWLMQKFPITERHLLLPEVVIEDAEQSVTKTLKSLFDLIWNACGQPASTNWDDEGNWINKRYQFS